MLSLKMMSGDNSTEKSQHPHILDRERLAPLRQQHPRETTEQDLINLYKTADRKEAYAGRNEAKIFSHLGKSLIRYAGIDDPSIRYMDQLLGNFRSLGYHVAFLVDSLKSRGLIDEEFAWLGSLKSTPRRAGAEQFEFTDDIELLPTIQDCSPQEKNRLYSVYLEGQTSYWNTKYPYELPKER